MLVAAAATAYAASLSLSTKHVGGASLTTPVFFPRSIATANGSTRVGLIQSKDTITWTWPGSIKPTTLCSGWTNTTGNGAVMTWIIQDNAGSTGNDVLAPGSTGGTCATGLHIGTVDLGSPGYITGGNGTLSSTSTIEFVSGGTSSLQVTLNAAPTGGTAGIVSSGSAAVWTPDPAVTDLSGNNCAACLAKSTATVQF